MVTISSTSIRIDAFRKSLEIPNNQIISVSKKQNASSVSFSFHHALPDRSPVVFWPNNSYLVESKLVSAGFVLNVT